MRSSLLPLAYSYNQGDGGESRHTPRLLPRFCYCLPVMSHPLRGAAWLVDRTFGERARDGGTICLPIPTPHYAVGVFEVLPAPLGVRLVGIFARLRTALFYRAPLPATLPFTRCCFTNAPYRRPTFASTPFRRV